MRKTIRKRGRSLRKPVTRTVDGEKKETITPSLPDDVIVDILLVLPVKSIIRFRCVCKNWRNWLSRDPSFAKWHLKNSIESGKLNCFSINGRQEFSIFGRKSSSLPAPQDGCFFANRVLDFPLKSHPDVLIDTHGSCNGLILMRKRRVRGSQRRDINLCLWNPTTKEFKEIKLDSQVKHGSPLSKAFGETESNVTYGFGYNCDTDDYKIVKANVIYEYNITSARFVDYGSEIQVYTLGSDSWKTLPDIVPYKIVDSCTRASVNGALYWIATPCPSEIVKKSNLILSFDIKSENFSEVALTSQVSELFGSNNPMRRMTLSVLGGCLCVVSLGPSDTEVWVMKDHKVRESWTKLCVAQIAVKNPLMCCMILQCELKNNKNNEVLLFRLKQDGDRYADAYYVIFVTYDLVHHKYKVLDKYTIFGKNCSIETYVESLVSISGTHEEYPTRQKQAAIKHQKRGKLAEQV